MRLDDRRERQRRRRERVRQRWSPPAGPLPAGPGGDSELRPGPGETLDSLSGEWRIFQRRDGHRYSTDDLLTAWYACHLASREDLAVERALDLGAGIGSVALMVAWRFPRARVLGLEAQALSASLFRRSVRYNGAADRVEVRDADLRRPDSLPEGPSFDLVTGSPPYLPVGTAVASRRPQCDPCRIERRGGVEEYAGAAARALRPSGIFVLVHEERARERVAAAAASAGLHPWRTLPVIFRDGRPPHIALYAFTRARCLPLREDPLVIRDRDGRRSERFQSARHWMGFPP